MSSFTRDVLTLSGGSIVSQALVLIASPLLTRLYLPESFGIATLLLAIVVPISAIACLRYDVGIMLPSNEGDALNLLVLSICSASLISLLVAGVQPLLKYHISSVLNAPGLLPYLWCAAPLVLIKSIYSSFNYWQSRNRCFASVSFAEVNTSLGTIAYQIVAAIKFLASSGGLIFGYIFGSTLSTIMLGFSVAKSYNNKKAEGIRLNNLLRTAHRYRKFPLFDTWGVLFNSISWQLPALMLAVFFSPVTVGLYALADRIVKVPMLLVGGAISKVFLQRASKIVGQEEALSGLVEKVFTVLIAIGILPTILIGLIGQDIVKVVFGPNWGEAGLYLQVLSVWMFVWFVSSPMSTLFIIFERQELALFIHASIFFSRLVSFTVGGISDSVLIALGFFSATGTIVYSILLIWSLKQVRINFSFVLHVVGRYFFYSSPIVIAMFVFKFTLHLSSFYLLVAALPMLLLYYAYVYKKEYAVLISLGVIKQ
jgi:lipopolysaccharide exporter